MWSRHVPSQQYILHYTYLRQGQEDTETHPYITFLRGSEPSVQSLSWLLSSQKTFVVDARSSSVDVGAAGDIDGVATTAREQTTMAINRLLAFTLMTLSY